MNSSKIDQLISDKLWGEEKFQIIIGTYEEYLVGYSLYYNKDSKKFHFHQQFTNHAHSGSIKAITCSENGILVSGSSDETCHLINLRKKIEIGTLIEQEGAILDLAFYNERHLFSASEDGTICIWDTKTWTCEKKLSGHKSSVNSICIHSSGKLMFSISKDKTVRTWNLIKGRSAFVANLKEIPNIIKLSNNDKHFMIVYNKHIDIYDMTICGIVCSIQVNSGISCGKYLKSNSIILCTEVGEIQIWDLYQSKPNYAFHGHNRRIKDIYEIPKNLISIKECDLCICTISSDGFLRLWNIINKTHQLLVEQNINCRPTCFTFHSRNKSPTSLENNLTH